MKRITILLLVSFYLIATTGFSVTLHFCGGKLASYSLIGAPSGKCICGMAIETKGCCHSQTISLGFHTVHQQTETTSPDFNKSLVESPIIERSTAIFLFSSDAHAFLQNSHPPPDDDQARLYLEYRVFRI